MDTPQSPEDPPSPTGDPPPNYGHQTLVYNAVLDCIGREAHAHGIQPLDCLNALCAVFGQLVLNNIRPEYHADFIAWAAKGIEMKVRRDSAADRVGTPQGAA